MHASFRRTLALIQPAARAELRQPVRPKPRLLAPKGSITLYALDARRNWHA
jgi:hypothetical protein